MGQFEYTVRLARPLSPEDAKALAKEYLANKEKNMVEYEHNTLVLDSSHSKEDQEAINNFINQKINEERDRIFRELTSYSHYDTLQIAKFKLKQIINDTDVLEY